MFEDASQAKKPPDFKAIRVKTDVIRSSIYKLRSKAISRGWIPDELVEPEHVNDAPRSGRPTTSTATALFIIETMTKNSTTRGWSCARIAAEVTGTPGRQPVSASTVYRVLTENGYGVFKRTVKPGLTEEMKKARLAWCLERQHWTLDDWKNVIFSDETSVVLGGVRGKRRVWRKKDETPPSTLYNTEVERQEGVYVVELLFMGRQRSLSHLGKRDGKREEGNGGRSQSQKR
jgi:hypothetical protein